MTIHDMTLIFENHPRPLCILLLILPLFSFVYGNIHKKGKGEHSPHKFVYSSLIYLSCIPGIFACVITAYSLFFLGVNLLEINFIVYLMPIFSMFVTLVVIGQNVSFEQVPGFDRLLGLVTLLGVSFVIVLGIMKTRIWILFGGSMGTLLSIATFLFLLLKWASHQMFRKKETAKRTPPSYSLKR